MGCLSVLFNLIWILTGGWMTALAFLLAGVVFCVTIVGIPLGRQAFKMASLTLAPFGKTVTYGGGAPSLVANVFWVVLVGLWTAIGYAVEGAIFCVTIVGIPFGLQLFKMAKLALCPFGAEVR
ncbi:YccF domain-containing protein [Thermophilibacter mediterraneus]|uniref:YccF domain-containing protein n=1 Tax=Thermophilibacter mediterraneus TaxID=1871031 RepID=UPI000B1462F4|nr:YccF domain-containing protein [Thermophilibacter mediterraneus]